MKTTISLSTPAQLETESLVTIVLDHADPAQKQKNKDAKLQLKIATGDAAVQSAAADLLASGELTGKPFEINSLHKPAVVRRSVCCSSVADRQKSLPPMICAALPERLYAPSSRAESAASPSSLLRLFLQRKR